MIDLQLSYSSIKDFELLSPYEWKDKWINRNFPKEIKRAFSFGSLLDCLVFEPDELHKRFIVMDTDFPSDAICDMVHSIITQGFEKEKTTLLDYTDDLVQQINQRAYWSNRKPETNLKNVLKDGSEYFKLVSTSKKTIVSQKDVDKCYRLRQAIWDHPIARRYVIPEKDTELEFQKTIKVPYELNSSGYKVILKAIFDCQFTDHNLMTRQVVDLKSTASSYGFDKSVEKYRYGGQVGVYCHNLFKDLALKGGIQYEILPPVNLVVDKQSEQVFIYNYTWEQLKQERWGNDTVVGWHHLIGEIARRYYENDWEK